MIFTTVLRSGGIYTPEWVRKLKAQVEGHSPGWPFVCLSDTPIEGVETIPMLYEYPGWWSKMELFCPHIFRAGTRVCFMDLDTLLVAPQTWHEKVPEHGFGALTDAFRGEGHLQSSVMVFTAGSELVTGAWDAFRMDAAKHMKNLSSDQIFLENHLKGDWWALQDYSDAFVSFKAGARESVPEGKEVVFFHGNPRPNDPAAGWGYEEWSRW